MNAVYKSHGLYGRLPDLQQDSFRLVVLRPGQFDDLIDCSLMCCSMTDAPVYEALSYAWGDRRRGSPITLNKVPFMVFENLGKALRQLRDAHNDRTLWIDAICINQEDLEERSCQVQKMPQIYQGAKEVVIWLGEQADESDQAINDLLALNVNEHLTETSFYKEFTIDRLNTADGKIVDRAYPLRCLFERGWFKRMWTLQEIVLAQKASFYCGRRRFSWECLEHASDNYNKHVIHCCKQEWKKLHRDAIYLWYPIGQFTNLVSRLRCARNRYTLLDVLLLCRARLAEDERDKIHAIKGLYNADGVEEVNSDYTLPWRELYIQVAQMLIEGKAGLRLLTHVFSAHQSLGLPSWVPDWSRDDYNNPNSLFSGPDYLNLYHASGLIEPEAAVINKVLCVRAIIIDTISACPPMLRSPNGKGKLRPKGFNTLEHFLEWESLAGIRQTDTSPYFSGPDDNCDAFWRTMIMDVWKNSQSGQYRRALPTDYQAYLKWRPWFQERSRPGGDPDGSLYATGIQDPELYTFDVDILTNNSVRRFFRTKNGHIGMGPMEMQIGDQVMVLAGAKEPFVMRPLMREGADSKPDSSSKSSFTRVWKLLTRKKDTNSGIAQSSDHFEANSERGIDNFTLVGFSYLHGFMDGEATMSPKWRKVCIH